MVLLPVLVSSSPGVLVLLAGAPHQAEHALAAQAQLDLELLWTFVLKNLSLFPEEIVFNQYFWQCLWISWLQLSKLFVSTF